MTTPTQVASFKVRAAAFPATNWFEFCKVFKPRYTDRDHSGPSWYRLDGPGYTIWMTDWHFFDSRSSPPVWEIRLEALAALNESGDMCWQEVCEGIEHFIRAYGLERVEV